MWKTWFFFSLIYLICKTSALPKECKEDENGLKYEGTKSMSSSGGPCLSWKHQLVQRQFNTYNNSMLKENYCRNPDGHTSPWCFVEYLKIYRSVPFLPRGRIRESGFFGDRGPGFTLRQVKHIKKDPCDIPFCFEASFEWNGENKTFGIQLSNSTKMVNNNKTGSENNYILRIEPLLPNTSSIETSLKLPYLRPVSTGSCLQLEYRTKNLKLELKTASQTLTLLSESNEWKFVNVNIRPEAKEYQVSISSVSLPAFSKFAEVKYIRVREGSCQGCFPCFNDGLCVNKSGFCDVNIDCPDFSDERNCALECFFHNYYAGFRNETISFDPCANGKCSFHKERYAKPGCVVENKWKPCNLDECERGNLTCTFVDNTCGWKPWKNGLKWRRKVNKNTGKAFVFPDKTIDVNWSLEDISILYSAPQPPSTEYSCLSISYSGRNSHIEAFITNGTMLLEERKVPVFQHLNIDSDDVKSTTFQTPIDTAFMVMIQANYTSKSDSVLKIHTIFQEIGICKDKDPCDLSQFQCIDGSCISSQKLCNNISNCPEDEDETFCKKKSFIIGVPIVHVCPAHCQCHDLIFKCSSIIDVTDEARSLEILSFHNFDIQRLEAFRYLVNLNLSASLDKNTSLRDILEHLGSRHLQKLDISFNYITFIAADISFKNLPNLLYFNVSNNMIHYLDLSFLKQIPTLRFLNLKNNKINEMYFYDNKYHDDSNETNLALLDLTGNEIRSIQPGSLYFLKALIKLDLRDNNISNTNNYFSKSMKIITYLDLGYNSIEKLSLDMFEGLNRLIELNMEHNKIEQLDPFTFFSLPSLHTLNLAFNNVRTIHRLAMENLSSLKKLNLTGNKIVHLGASLFAALKHLQILDLSENAMKTLERNAFESLGELKSLYIHGNELVVSKSMFEGLCNLERLRTDSYIICCVRPSTVDVEKCISPRDRISTCEQLISVGVLAQMIWYMALFSFGGNIFVIYYRLKIYFKGSATSQTLLILNLSISDLLMGIYLFIIAVADLEYRNKYGLNDSKWRFSNICTAAGLLATISSEASVLFVFLITAERFIAFKYPFSSANLKTQKCGTCAAITVWLFAVGIATAPLFFYSDFYSRSTVCISLPLTTDMFSGWEYSTLVFIVFNLLVFIAVVLGQILIFAEVKRIGSNVTNDTTKREIAVFKSLSYVVLSDAFCWIPIVLIGLLALGGVNISSDVYAWIVVVVLPINSALNPFIYTLSIMNKNKTKQCHSKST
ncbi:relaxin receptor 1 [Magallana gigas]|uniref:relaxin receptor 1 n=1 Tax=Magallana gigas TaxID=29159 RepID=UPI00333F6E8F